MTAGSHRRGRPSGQESAAMSIRPPFGRISEAMPSRALREQESQEPTRDRSESAAYSGRQDLAVRRRALAP